MNKIGILTWWRNTNYGGCLQGLALQEYLKRLGYCPEMINYLPLQSDVRLWQDFCSRLYAPKSNRGWLRDLIVDLIRPIFVLCFQAYKVDTIRRVHNAMRFFRQNFVWSHAEYATERSLNEQTEYETILLGSDQVWNPGTFRVDAGYLLTDMPDKVARVAYAPSVTVGSIRGYERYYLAALPKFAAISLREKSALDELSLLIGRPIRWVVDPTLLLSRSDWNEVLSIEDGTSGDVVVYWLSDVMEIVEPLLAHVKRSGEDVYLYTDARSYCLAGLYPRAIFRYLTRMARLRLCRKIHVCKREDARGFVQRIARSRHVYTNSFHGLVFGTIYRKPVSLVLDKDRKGMASRMTDFLEKIRSKNVPADSLQAAFESSVQIQAEDSLVLSEWIEMSKIWLESAMSKVCTKGCR